MRYADVNEYLRQTGVLFANMYGIGQTLPDASGCTYYLDCPGEPVTPSIKHDFSNAADFVTFPPNDLHLTPSMTFPDLARPAGIQPQIDLLEKEYPGTFR